MMSLLGKMACGLWLILILCVLTIAQVEGRGKAMNQKRPKREGKTSGKATLTVAQQGALLALDQILSKADSFSDPPLVAKTQAQVADMLWKYDEPRARNLFEEAFSKAVLLKSAKQEVRNSSTSTPTSIPQSNDLLKDVLSLISRRDGDMAERLIASISKVSTDDDVSEKQPNYREILSESYLQAAASIVDSDPQRAAQLIKVSLNGGIGRTFPKVLGALRRKSPASVGEIISLALAVARADASRIDENTRLLAQFVFSDFGLPSNLRNQNASPNDQADNVIIRSFLDFTFEVAIRWHSKVVSTGNRAAAARDIYDYDTAQTLQSYFIQYAPDKADQFRGIVTVMSQGVPKWQTNDLADKVAQPASFDEAVKEAEGAKDSLQRDILYFRAATAAASGGEFDRALSLVEKVSSEDFRTGFDTALRLHAVNALVGRDEIDLAYGYAKDAIDLKQRAALLGRIANVLIDRKNTSQALRILDDAGRLISKTDESLATAQALLILANARSRVDSSRGFEEMEAAVKAFNRANAEANKKGDAKAANASKAMFSAMISKMFSAEAPSFEQGLQTLSRSDFDRALSLARSLDDPKRAVQAQLAVCETVLLAVRKK